MNQNTGPVLCGLIAGALVAPAAAASLMVDFEDVTLPTAYGGPGGGSYNNGSGEPGKITSNGVDFINTYDSGFGSWDGFAASNTSDTTTAGFTNQYSAFTGSGLGGSGNYMVGYENAFAGSKPTIDIGGPVDLGDGSSVWITNTTYAGLAVRDGNDGFGGVTQFGGVDGNTPDWFLLTIEGFNGTTSTGTIEFYLADYRFSDNSLDYVIEDWTLVDLTSLGSVDSIEFGLSSSDNGDFGMNTPAYFAMDNLTIPEPSALLLALLGSTGLLRRRR